MGKLDDRVAIVTGGLSGIGRRVAELFTTEGACVALVDVLERSRDDGLPGDAIARGLRRDALFVRADVADEADVERAVAAVVDRLGRLDVLANFAGVALFKPVTEISADEFDRVMSVNVRGTFLACKHAIAQMRRQPARGVIVNTASNFAFVAAPEASVYCASKGAVVTLTKGLALEVAPEGIRVNALCPGATATEFNRAHRARPEVVADWQAKTPLRLAGREDFLGRAEEIARSALFLACDDSIYMTGASLVVDGGWNAQ